MAGRNPSIDWVALKLEYVYADPKENVTLSTLADKHSIARSGLAAKAAGRKDEPSWADERETFRSRLNDKTLAALADKWAAFETVAREKRMETANAVLDVFITDLAEGRVKIASKDAVEWISVMRQEFDEVRNASDRAKVVEGDVIEMTDAQAREAIETATKLLEAGKSAPASE